MRLGRPCDDEQPGGVAVEPVDDPGPVGLLAARSLVRQQAVDEGPGRMARRRMDDEPGRLVDDEQVLVLVGDPQRQLLRLERARRRVGHLDRQLLPALQPVALRTAAPVDLDPARGERALRGGTGAELGQSTQEPVEPRPRRVVRDD